MSIKQLQDINIFHQNLDLRCDTLRCEDLSIDNNLSAYNIVANNNLTVINDGAIGNDLIVNHDLNVTNDTTVNNLDVTGTLTADIGEYINSGSLVFQPATGTGLFVSAFITYTRIKITTGVYLVHLVFPGANTSVNIGGSPSVIQAVLPPEITGLANYIAGITSFNDSGGNDLVKISLSSGMIQLTKVTGNFNNSSAGIDAFEISYLATPP